ncbi:hypothetical protein H4R99_006967 [Coemansia sp. RSA 1722]|nr:hypothetical protein LPJ57_007732 [Coemansia sp. RSA 486]KAJ2221663.1 hypothetical protein IWW45_008812 [Coemansia sp. RSA 485]KAJ2590840.1 hypothetical protein H4R99_006967 [Coemansia sp. RSA 1722]
MSNTTTGPASTATQLMAALSLDERNSTEGRQINSSALEFLLPELVGALVSTTLRTKQISERIALGLDIQHDISDDQDDSKETDQVTKGKPASGNSTMASGWLELPEDEELMEQVCVKLEMVGFRVGRRIAERFAPLNRRLTDTLDIVKFICKDVWMLLFNRQVDNLKTNHRGVYVLQDNKFKWFLRMSGNNGGAAAARRAQPYIWLPCGIIRGVLDSFGTDSVVIAETLGLPQCTFQIKVQHDKTEA